MPIEQSKGETAKVVSAKERQLWAHVAAHTAEVMGNLAKGFEEQQFDDDLAKLENLVDDIKKFFKLKQINNKVQQIDRKTEIAQ